MIDLAAERVNVDVKSVDDWLDVLKIVLFKGLELSNCAKQTHLALASKTELDVAEVYNIVLAVGDHLVGDLDEKRSHTLSCVVVARNSVDHLDGVHEGWESLSNGVRVANIKRLEGFLKSLEILDVILSLR